MTIYFLIHTAKVGNEPKIFGSCSNLRPTEPFLYLNEINNWVNVN